MEVAIASAVDQRIASYRSATTRQGRSPWWEQPAADVVYRVPPVEGDGLVLLKAVVRRLELQAHEQSKFGR